MSEIRVIVSHTLPSEAAAEADVRSRVDRCFRVEADEEGCRQFEVFRSAVHPSNFVLLMRWADEASYDRHFGRSAFLAQRPQLEPGHTMDIEFYRRQLFAYADGAWNVAEPERRIRSIRW
jgi:quinol monooxygenase YgiN